MTRYAKRKLKYSLNENFNLLPYVEWDAGILMQLAIFSAFEIVVYIIPG
jgi:hypothetical protein